MTCRRNIFEFKCFGVYNKCPKYNRNSAISNKVPLKTNPEKSAKFYRSNLNSFLHHLCDNRTLILREFWLIKVFVGSSDSDVSKYVQRGKDLRVLKNTKVLKR